MPAARVGRGGEMTDYHQQEKPDNHRFLFPLPLLLLLCQTGAASPTIVSCRSPLATVTAAAAAAAASTAATAINVAGGGNDLAGVDDLPP